MIAIYLCDTCHYVIKIIYISTSVFICSKIIRTFIFSQYFRYTEELILKVYHKKVLLLPSNPSINAGPNMVEISKISRNTLK